MKTKVIISILKDLEIYEKARAQFDSDEQLAETFDRDFDGLAAMFKG